MITGPSAPRHLGARFTLNASSWRRWTGTAPARTVSTLAGIDLHSGHFFANVEDRHRSVEFIALLKKLD
jgi:hypothetical protein